MIIEPNKSKDFYAVKLIEYISFKQQHFQQVKNDQNNPKERRIYQATKVKKTPANSKIEKNQ